MNSKKTSRVIDISSVGETWYDSEWVSCKVCWDDLRELVPFVLFKKSETTHGGVLLLVTLLHGSFTFLKLYKYYQIVQSIT